MKRKPLDELELTFQIPPQGINAIHMGFPMVFAPGPYRCTDPAVARFLYAYPGTTLIGEKPIPPSGPIAANDPRVFDPLPEESRVVSGGFSGGSVGTQKFLKPAMRPKGK